MIEVDRADVSRAPGRHRLAVRMVLVLAVTGALVLPGAPALAHAQLLATSPFAGARLRVAPTAVSLHFSDSVAVAPGAVQVFDHRGGRVDAGAAGHPAGQQAWVVVQLRPGLTDGSYSVSWRAVSEDTHPVQGAFTFVVGSGPLPTTTVATAGVDRSVSTLFAVARLLAFSGLALLVGGATFLLLCWPAGCRERRARVLLWSGWGMTAFAAGSALLLQGPYTGGGGLHAVVTGAGLTGTLATRFGIVVSARLVLLGLAGLWLTTLLPRRTPIRGPAEAGPVDAVAQLATAASGPVLTARPATALAPATAAAPATAPSHPATAPEPAAVANGGVLMLGLLLTWPAVGHPAAGMQSSLAMAFDATHLGAMSVWIGGLVVLVAALMPLRRTAELARALPTFSRLAFSSIAVLIVTGTYQSWREVGTLAALPGTGYGRLLLAKLAGVVAVLALGNLARVFVRRHYVPGLVAPDPSGSSFAGLRRGLMVELGVGGAVLAVTAVLVASAPARDTYHPPAGAALALPSGGRVVMGITPARMGQNDIDLRLTDRGGRALDAAEVRGVLALPARRVTGLPVRLRRVGPGHYTAPATDIPFPGRWQLAVTVRIGDFDESTTTTDVRIR